MIIVIIGPDGSGKTTIANGLVELFKKKEIKVNHIAMHFEILPPLKTFINPFLKKKIDDSHEEGEYYAGMKVKPNSRLKGMIYVFWYALDYFLGYFTTQKSKKNSEITVFARYYYDYYYQRGHINTPKFFIRLMQFIVPKPDLIFTILRPAEDIFNQKPELSIEEIKRQQNKINSFLKDKNNAHIIDGKLGVEASIQNVFNIINNKLEI